MKINDIETNKTLLYLMDVFKIERWLFFVHPMPSEES